VFCSDLSTAEVELVIHHQIVNNLEFTLQVAEYMFPTIGMSRTDATGSRLLARAEGNVIGKGLLFSFWDTSSLVSYEYINLVARVSEDIII